MRTLSLDDLENLALGAAILGSGGGGSPSYNLLMAKYCCSNFQPVTMLELEEISEADLVVPIGFMGAPLVATEKIASGKEFMALQSQIQKYFGKKPSVLMPAEIGGANAFTPIIAGAILGLPVLNADSIGRAFPELQMSVFSLHGVSPAPAFFADAFGNSVIINAQDAHTVERLARQTAIGMGSRAAAALYLMHGEEARRTAIPQSITHAIHLGKVIRQARENQEDPTQALIAAANGAKLASGTIQDIDYKIEGGFLNGTCYVENDQGEVFNIFYKNEFLSVRQGNTSLAATPDILMLLEQETGTPVTSSDLAYGQRVDLVTLPSPSIWKTPEGLKRVGPEYFNL